MHHRTAYVLLLLTTLFWGGNSVAGKLAVGHISPMVLTTMRWAFALAIIAALGWVNIRRDWPMMRRHAPILLLLGTLGFTLFNVALYNGLLYTTAINTAVEQAGIPMLIFLFGFLIFRTRVTWAQIAGVVISIAGVVLTASHGEPARLLELDINFGDLLLLGGIVVYGIYTVLLRLKPAIHWQSLMTALTAAAFVTSLPFLWAEQARGDLILPDRLGWAILVYVVIFPSILSQIFYIRSVELIGPNRAGLFVNLVPIFGTLLSLLIIGEDFHLYHAIALALVFAGIWLAETSGRRAVG
jgi:drug/metabolite transporter (DMT)-like permease